jgi:hypothetical protein
LYGVVDEQIWSIEPASDADELCCFAIIDSDGVNERSLFLTADAPTIASDWIMGLRDVFIQHRAAVALKANTYESI